MGLDVVPVCLLFQPTQPQSTEPTQPRSQDLKDEITKLSQEIEEKTAQIAVEEENAAAATEASNAIDSISAELSPAATSPAPGSRNKRQAGTTSKPSCTV